MDRSPPLSTWPGGGVAGVEGGSDRVSGRQLMDVWDRLCSLLGARVVSVEDVSNKARRLPLPGTGPAGVEGVTVFTFPDRRCDMRFASYGGLVLVFQTFQKLICSGCLFDVRSCSTTPAQAQRNLFCLEPEGWNIEGAHGNCLKHAV